MSISLSQPLQPSFSILFQSTNTYTKIYHPCNQITLKHHVGIKSNEYSNSRHTIG